MGALMHILAACHRKFEKRSLINGIAKAMNQASEPFWFVLTLALFMLMGPFSIIAVIAGLYQLSLRHKNQSKPESFGC